MTSSSSEITWSVVITTRNRADMLRRAIKSCLAQTIPCEVVVVDEASSDATPEVVSGFGDLVYLRNDTPLGHSGAANLGIRSAKGSWIKALDDDDWLAPTCLEALTEAITKARQAGLAPVIASVGAIEVDAEEHELRRSRLFAPEISALRSADLLRLALNDRAPIGTPVQFAHARDAALKVGGWIERAATTANPHGDEVEFTIEISAVGDAVFVPQHLAYRTVWAQNSWAKLTCLQRYQANLGLKDRLARHLGLAATPLSVRSTLALHWALVALKTGRRGEALRLLAAWLAWPFSALSILQRHAPRRERIVLQPS